MNIVNSSLINFTFFAQETLDKKFQNFYNEFKHFQEFEEIAFDVEKYREYLTK